jgi:hypothetical protein
MKRKQKIYKTKVGVFLHPTLQKLRSFLILLLINILLWYAVFRPNICGAGGCPLSTVDMVMMAVALITGLFSGLFMLYPTFTPLFVGLFIISLFWTYVLASLVHTKWFRVWIGLSYSR